MNQEVIEWLLEGDVSVQYLVNRDLLETDEHKLSELQQRIVTEGFGKGYLDRQNDKGHWGRGFYQPKWTSTHYSLLDMMTLGMPVTPEISRTIDMLVRENKSEEDGGINPAKTTSDSDVCINGMFMNYGCWFGVEEKALHSVVDLLIREQIADGGFNCRSTRSGCKHSSVHTTLSVLEGIERYRTCGYTYKLDKLLEMAEASREFLLIHRLYKSDHTGEVIHKNFTMFSFPARWYYDVLRALEYFADAKIPYDERMEDALVLLRSKETKNGRWKAQNRHPGEMHFELDKTGKESRFNTYRALKVLKFYN